MSFDAQLEDPKVEKHTLLVVRPRIRVTGWTNTSGDIYSAPFTYGYVTRAWKEYDFTDGLEAAPNASLVNDSEYYYDHANQLLYVYSSAGDPDSYAYPGITAEFELNLSSKAFTGPRDPKNGTSQVVNWIPALREVPLAQNGSRQTLYGFLPMGASQIQVFNHDGWMNPFLYSASFNYGMVKAYLLVNEDLNDGVRFSEVRDVFQGYTSSVKMSGFGVTITCSDFLSFFDKEIPLRKITDTSYGSLIEPAARELNREWYIRRIFGIHKNFRPINVDYNASASTTNNREWITHEQDFALDGSNQDDGDLGYAVDDGAANSGTRTYFTTTPKVRVGDSMIIQRSGTDRYVFIAAVNRAAKYVDHDAIVGSAAPGDSAIRYFIGTVMLEDPDGNRYTLKAGRDFTRLIDNTNDVRGFVLADNVESGFLNTPFDPATWKIACTVYGRRELDQYEDLTDVGEVVDNGGVAAQAITALYRLLVDAGYAQADISDSLFQLVQDDSYSIGLAIPSTHDGAKPKFIETISKILKSNMYKISIAEEGSALKLGVTQVGPFVSAGDYEADELNHRGIEFEQDYVNVYSDVRLQYSRFEIPELEDTEGEAQQGANEFGVVLAENLAALNLHFIRQTFDIETLLVNEDEAQELADRLAIALGERRGIYTFDFELAYTNKANLGASYNVSRQHLPGFAFAEGTLRTRQLLVLEVNKNSRGVSITFEDQKGVQDNSGSW